MTGIKNKGVKYTVKYWFARGYSDGLSDLDNPPSLDLKDYYLELLAVNVIEEYNLGIKVAKRDLINGKID
jgi:hypothetical protein